MTSSHDAIEPSRDIAMLLAVMKALRDPVSGCPWDVVQSFETIAPYTIEEAYEVADAIERQDMDDLSDELGDLLLQVVYHAQMAEERDTFDFGDVVYAITKKMIRRHPHVFGDTSADSAKAVKVRWEDIKAEEKREKAARKGMTVEELVGSNSVLSGIPRNLPSLTYSLKLQKKAAKVGFDWDDPGAVVDKIAEEAREIVDAVEQRNNGNADTGDVESEIGDLLFAVTNLARHLGIDADNALRRTNAKFERRFGQVEAELNRKGKTPAEATLEEMEAAWQAAKRLSDQSAGKM